MKISELEDGDQLATKEVLRAELAVLRAELEAKMTKLILESERAQRNLVLGLYGLVIISVFLNHLWR